MKSCIHKWKQVSIVLLGAVAAFALFFVLIKLCFPSTAPTLNRITFEKGAEVHILYTYPSGCEGEDITLSQTDSKTIVSVLNACGSWTSNTCDCAGGVVVVIGDGKLSFGGEGVRWLEDHFHYIGKDLCVEIPEKRQKKLDKILSPYLDH